MFWLLVALVVLMIVAYTLSIGASHLDYEGSSLAAGIMGRVSIVVTVGVFGALVGAVVFHAL
jgi:hypothetical protein